MKVLAVSIVIVFCLGLIKLWWTNRSVRKHEIIDEEKRARLTEMRKTGIPTKKGQDIPFGIRAIQSGIEVDGIWISRPATPSRSSSKSKLTLSTMTIIEVDEDGKVTKKHVSDDGRVYSGMAMGRPSPFRTPSGLSAMDASSGSEGLDAQSTQSMQLPQISEDSALASDKGRSSRLNEQALRRLEGQTAAARAPLLTTYIPSSKLISPNPSISRNHYRPSKRSSASSSESVSSSDSSRNPSSSSSQKSFSERAAVDGRPGFRTRPQAAQGREGQGREAPPPHSPVRYSTATTSTMLSGSGSESQSSPLTSSHPPLAMPQPTFGPGDTYANRSARRVNAGFEVLPAGTFGGPHDLSRSTSGESRHEEDEHGTRISRTLRKISSQSLGKRQQ